MFLGLDTAFNEPLQQSQLNCAELRQGTTNLWDTLVPFFDIFRTKVRIINQEPLESDAFGDNVRQIFDGVSVL